MADRATSIQGDASRGNGASNNHSATLVLPDGRLIGYASYGSPSGRAVIYLHGIGGSRLEGAYFDKIGRELNARIIAVERPGMGWSSPRSNRKLLDFPPDLQHLIEHLGLDQYAILGISGGGAYALACAKALPFDKLKGVSIVCGLGPPDMGTRGMPFMNKIGVTVAFRYLPWVIMQKFKTDPFTGCLELTDEQRIENIQKGVKEGKINMHEKDLKALEDLESLRLVMRSTREAAAQGYGGIGQDTQVICSEYNFRIEDIRDVLPFQLWYGRYDEAVPINHGEQMAARLGSRARLRVEDETHGSIHVTWRREIFSDLLATFD